MKIVSMNSEELRLFLKGLGVHPWIIASTIAGGKYVNVDKGITVEKDTGKDHYLVKENN